MIVGIDHIAFSVSDIEKGLSQVASWGYRAKFVEKGVLNHVAKTPFLRKREGKHDIAYCESPAGGVAIELTAHNMSSLASPYEVSFSRAFPKVINAISLETSDVEQSIAFWSKLGFKCHPEHRAAARRAAPCSEGSHLSFVTPLSSQKLDLKLIHVPKKQKQLHYIDDQGFPCLAFLTTHIERDRILLGNDASDIFSITVHQQILDICLGRGPNGECVELIAIRKRL